MSLQRLKQNLSDVAFDATVPTTSAVADAAATGSATTSARRDHKHGREAFATPVAIGASNAAGAATTVPRSDHVHSNSGVGQWLIYDSGDLTGVADTGAITIPATATHLEIHGLLRSSANLESDYMLMRCNADSGNNYTSMILVLDQNGTNYQDFYGATKSHIPVAIEGSAATVPVNNASRVRIVIPVYQSTAFDKEVEVYGSFIKSSATWASANFYIIHGYGVWRPATPAAITALRFSTNSGSNFVSGSQFQIYGIK
jgi:hypothetical protein